MTLIQNWIDNVEEKIFKRFRDEQEGEMDEDTYMELVGDIIHEEIDHSVTNEYMGEVEDAVREYGINKAICLYISEYGAEAFGNLSGDCGQYSRCLVYVILREYIDISYLSYIKWCEKN